METEIETTLETSEEQLNKLIRETLENLIDEITSNYKKSPERALWMIEEEIDSIWGFSVR